MDIALIGYGKMGKAIERIAIERGHDIVCRINSANRNEFEIEAFRNADVAIEFTTPLSAFDNCRRCFESGVPVVSGTTGWLERMEELKKICDEKNAAFFYSSNFSIGVNIFFALNRYLAKIMNRFGEYDVSMKEIHHIHKLDHPSGTAITLAHDIIDNVDRKKSWSEESAGEDVVNIVSERVGEVPGTHIVNYVSAVDAIRIEHEAFSRKGFAAGAVAAAEWLAGRKGWFNMEDMLDFNV